MAAPAITHPFVSAIADDPAAALAGEVVPSNWNAAHTLADFSAASKLLGAGSAAATADEISLGAGLTMTGTTLSVTASVTLDAIAAAAGDQAGISNGDNNIRWNWALATNSTDAFVFGESAASTNGTSTNQVILKVSTVASSTACPFQIVTRGTTVMTAAATSSQLLFHTSSQSAPSLASSAVGSTGFDVRTPSVCIGGENTRWISGIQQSSYGAADAASYAINIRKSRGTVASPTVITSGDSLATITGNAYVGATNTYRQAAFMEFDSTGTISDATTGVGGIIRFGVMLQGTDTTAQEVGRFEQTGVLTSINKIYPGTDAKAFQTSCGLYAGTGAPNNANGADGDIYFRSDGGALTTIYQRRAGTWTGVV